MLPKPELTKFDGDPTKYLEFSSQFKWMVHDVIKDDAHRLAILRMYLSPKVQAEIGNSFFDPTMYRAVLHMLEDTYGMPEMVATKPLDQLLRTPPVNEHDKKGLVDFIIKIRGTVSALRDTSAGYELQSRVVLNNIVSRLPPSTQTKWTHHVIKSRYQLDVIHLSEWLQPIVQAERLLELTRPPSRPPASQQSKPNQGERQQQQSKNNGQWRVEKIEQKQQTMPHIFAVDAKDPRPPVKGTSGPPTPPVASAKKPPLSGTASSTTVTQCFACNRPRHSPFKCPALVAMSVDERVQLVHSKSRCLCCFGLGHKADSCPSAHRCRVETAGKPCGGDHHTLIHGFTSPVKSATYTVSSGGGGASGKGPVRTHPVPPEFRTLNINTSSSSDASESQVVLMAVVKVKLLANGRAVEAYALLDQGANSSLIRDDLAKVLLINPYKAWSNCTCRKKYGPLLSEPQAPALSRLH